MLPSHLGNAWPLAASGRTNVHQQPLGTFLSPKLEPSSIPRRNSGILRRKWAGRVEEHRRVLNFLDWPREARAIPVLSPTRSRSNLAISPSRGRSTRVFTWIFSGCFATGTESQASHRPIDGQDRFHLAELHVISD